MCGICGFAGPPDRDLLSRMTTSMAHRGPDGSGLYESPSGKVSLGHRRLSIIDLESGAQPMLSADRSLCITFNGEIYNYRELNAQLEADGARLRTASDTETLLHLYAKYGVDMLSRLNGMFAFALWDEPRQRLFIARDRLGVKPLYWARVGRRFLFASELKAILCHCGVDKTISPRSLSLYLSLRNIPEPATIYRGIQALPPAHFMLLGLDGQKVVSRYWSLDFSSPRHMPEESFVEELDALLKDATRLRMRADVPVGAYLSGGVDSSLVVAFMRQCHSGPLHTFSLAFADQPEGKNDPYYARLLADLYGTDHHEYVMDACEVGEELDNLMYFLEQPFGGVTSTYFLTKLVKQYVKVVLSGDGSDDQFASYGHHRLVWPLERLREMRAEGVADPYAVADLSPLTDRPEFIRRFDGLDSCSVRARFGAFTDEEKKQLFSPEYRYLACDYSAYDFYLDFWKKTRAKDPLNAMLEVDIQTLLPNEILFFCDRLSMAHSVESRSPFLDYRVLELSASIPGSLKIKGNVLKYILKKTAAKYLPNEILNRPKEGFVLPNHVWLRTKLDAVVARILTREKLAQHSFFDFDWLMSMIQEHKFGKRDHAFKIWTILMFQAWYDQCYKKIGSTR